MAANVIFVAMVDLDASIDEAEYDRWHDTEHVPERMACPGFISCQRFKLIDSPSGTIRVLVVYEVTGPEAMQSPEYLSLYNAVRNPTGAGSALTRTFAPLVKLVTRGFFEPVGPSFHN